MGGNRLFEHFKRAEERAHRLRCALGAGRAVATHSEGWPVYDRDPAGLSGATRQGFDQWMRAVFPRAFQPFERQGGT